MSIFGMGCDCGSSYKDEETRERLINVLERIADALEGPAKAEAARAAADYRERYVRDALDGMQVLTSNVEQTAQQFLESELAKEALGGSPDLSSDKSWCKCGHPINAHDPMQGCRHADSEGLCMCHEFRP